MKRIGSIFQPKGILFSPGKSLWKFLRLYGKGYYQDVFFPILPRCFSTGVKTDMTMIRLYI
jgi:hypothetical protein